VAAATPVRQVVNERTRTTVVTELRTAESFWENFIGLMFKKQIPERHGLLFQPARGIHTHFMRFPIDLIFLDRENRVTKVREGMRPWRFDFTIAAGVIEMNAGTARTLDIRTDDQLRFEEKIDVAPDLATERAA
jgi:uncharacterized membrane protein (UPF0127 family)